MCSGIERGRNIEKKEGTPRPTKRSIGCGNVCDLGSDEDCG